MNALQASTLVRRALTILTILHPCIEPCSAAKSCLFSNANHRHQHKDHCKNASPRSDVSRPLRSTKEVMLPLSNDPGLTEDIVATYRSSLSMQLRRTLSISKTSREAQTTEQRNKVREHWRSYKMQCLYFTFFLLFVSFWCLLQGWNALSCLFLLIFFRPSVQDNFAGDGLGRTGTV